MGSTIIAVVATASAFALAILGARMSWMKTMPGMLWVFIAVGIVAVVATGWQGYRNQKSGQEMKETLAKIQSQVEMLVHNSAMNPAQQQEMLANVRKIFAVDLQENINIGESIGVEVIRANATTPADPQSHQSPKRNP